MPYSDHDDIAQIGTPPGTGTLGALRISGDNAFRLLAACSAGLESVLAARPTRGVHDCRIRLTLAVAAKDGGRTEEPRWCPARAFLMPAPASYTREDVAELHLPGSPVVLRAALTSFVKAGARPAAPGEFTYRAFRNGRIRLGQAEAVEDVVRAANDAERRGALARFGDAGSNRIAAWRERVLAVAAVLEASLDFSGEETDAAVAGDLAAMAADLEREGVPLAASGRTATRELPHIALLGLTNAGKSSLLNALLEHESALAAPEASTTRDCLRREVEWNGVRFHLSDNPGYDPDGDGDGRLAADQAMTRLGGEDAACWVTDASRRPDAREHDFLRRLSGKIVIALSKSDLSPAFTPADAVAMASAAGLETTACHRVSAVTGEGVGELRTALAALARTGAAAGRWNGREALELARALEHCRAAAGEIAGAGRLELAAEDVRAAATSFSRALGEGYAEETLDRIFSSFCIGK